MDKYVHLICAMLCAFNVIKNCIADNYISLSVSTIAMTVCLLNYFWTRNLEK